MKRLWMKVRMTHTCWIWLGGRNSNGYGRCALGKRPNRVHAYAHRVVFEALVGPIPDDREIDHLCNNRRCVNPAHMELVTRRENMLRQWSRRRAVAA